MPLAKEVKTKAIQDFHRHDTDTGSPEVQIAILTNRILQLTEHLRANKHDEVLPARSAQAGRPPPQNAGLLAQDGVPALPGSHRPPEPPPQIDQGQPPVGAHVCAPTPSLSGIE